MNDSDTVLTRSLRQHDNASTPLAHGAPAGAGRIVLHVIRMCTTAPPERPTVGGPPNRVDWSSQRTQKIAHC